MVKSLFTPDISIDKLIATIALKPRILKFPQIKFNKIPGSVNREA